MGSKYIRIHIRQKMSTELYLYLYSTKNIDPNIFIFVFGPENHICHTLVHNKEENLVFIVQSLWQKQYIQTKSIF